MKILMKKKTYNNLDTTQNTKETDLKSVVYTDAY